jgi:hypothetical protein
LGNKIIALDGRKKSLLILETGKGLTEPCIIDLNNVAAVATRESYGSIQQGDLRNKNIEEFLERIDLQFKLKDSEETVAIPFYDGAVDTESDKLKLVRNAKNWQMVLSRLLGLQTGTNKNERNTEARIQLPLMTRSYV